MRVLCSPAVSVFSGFPCQRSVVKLYSPVEPCSVSSAPFLAHGRAFAALAEGRLSRRRYSEANTKGRSKDIQRIIKTLKLVPKAKLAAEFEKLHPREKLDVKRTLARRSSHVRSVLPTYKSVLFERTYFFREEDLHELSTLGQGPGGQATNRRMQTAIVKHVPTGICVKFSKFPSYWLNRKAAREALNLRLEEHLLGPKSRLGRLKCRREKRRLRRIKATHTMVERANIISAMRSQQREFHAVLTFQKPVPYAALIQLGMEQTKRSFFISDLFERECGQWWALLSKSFAFLNSGTATGGSGEVQHAQVPELLFYVFPSVLLTEDPPTSVQRYEWGQVQKCATCGTALRNVERALRCFVEIFGLCMHEESVAGAEGPTTLVIGRDGLNWVEFRPRMFKSSDQMTPLALAFFSHVVLSLSQLRCRREVEALCSYFSREAKVGASGSWAEQGIRGLRKVLERNSMLEELHQLKARVP
uniref:Uncharacterized protein TCIL3000_6_4360 n=1 Tax=Trypanosoma congolense (strain IL3000) TaxID=1068625 RepID=G0UP69_TRYCI|nr:unnamed protein product [Trypanosoma congolense IL3000]